MVSTTTILRRLPGPVRRAVMNAAREAKTPAQRMLLRLAGMRARPFPDPPQTTDAAIRLYVAPANYAAQGYAWARAVEGDGSIAAWNMEVRQPGGFAFAADRVVGLGPFHLSREWQQAEFASAAEHSHVLVEAGRSMFGGLFGYDVLAEIRALQQRGVSVAMISHGSDSRSPSAQRELTPWSPFHDEVPDVVRLQNAAERTQALMREANVPLFIATPELESGLPGAHWCPNVVDTSEWQLIGRDLMAGVKPVVVHVPTNPWIKGTPLIAPVLDDLASSNTLVYRSLSGISPDEMRKTVGDADIVLDQFRLGMYGTTAVEAMAAGRVVVGHVAASVRDRILRDTGLPVPIVEATPKNIGEVLRNLIGDRGRVSSLGAAGRAYASAVHDGRMSAQVLRNNWLDVNLDRGTGHVNPTDFA